MNNSDMPAAPTKHNSEHFQHECDYTTGLSKREHFAAMAMQGIASNHTLIDQAGCAKWVAKQSLSYADALLAALDD